MNIGRRILTVGLVLVLVATVAVAAPEKGRKTDVRPEKVIDGLKAGIWAARQIGAVEEAERLERVLKAYITRLEAEHHRKKKAEPNREVQIVRHRVEVLRIAMHALLEAERIDAAERVEHRIHMYELALAGRRDEEAMEIRKSAPQPAEMVKLLKQASGLWREYEQPKKAELCAKLAAEYGKAGKKGRKKEGGGEREMLERHVEVMRLAMKSLLEAGKRDQAERIEQAIHVYMLSLKGKHDEARKAREKAPNAGQLAELLYYSGDFWEKFGHEKSAGMVRELGRFYEQRWRDQQEKRQVEKRRASRGERKLERGDRETDRDERLERIQRQMEELHHAMRALQEEIERLKRDR